MRALLPGALALLGLFVLSGPAGATDLRSQTKAWSIEGIHALDLDLAAGQVAIEGSDGDRVRLTVGVHCEDLSESDCQRRARDIDLEATRRGDVLEIRVRNGSVWRNTRSHLRVEVQVPRTLPVDLEFKAGELEITDLGRDVHVAMGAGEARLRLREDDVGAVRAHVGVGDTRLRTREATYDGDGFISRSVRWEGGHGAARVKVTLGAGEVDVRLQ